MLELRSPMTTGEIAKKLKADEKSLQAKLDDMERRQIIRKINNGYVTPANIVAFHHGAIGWLPEELKANLYYPFYYLLWEQG